MVTTIIDSEELITIFTAYDYYYTLTVRQPPLHAVHRYQRPLVHPIHYLHSLLTS